MLSYQWDAQAVIERLNISLQCRGYLTWFDLTNMKGARLADTTLYAGSAFQLVGC